jgi:dTDP-4-amino-4,6-dideoxygalactose transaminase
MHQIELEPWTSIGPEEWETAIRTIKHAHHYPDDRPLSGFLGGEPDGGYHVMALEEEWAQEMGWLYAVSVNSATSGILLALLAVYVSSKDKVICSPLSMSAGPACIFWCSAEPWFQDIDPATYCLDPAAGPEDVVLTTSLFGHPIPRTPGGSIMIEDAAQAPFVPSEADITIYSLNVHKPMQVGEGGMICTNSAVATYMLRLLRNHGEMAGSRLPGLNLRMTEVTAAMAREQLKKGRRVVAERRELARRLNQALNGQSGITVPDDHPSHAYYCWAARVDPDKRAEIVRRLNESGVPMRAGYVEPLYTLPAFAPYAPPRATMPVTEKVTKELILLEMYAWDYTPEIMDKIADNIREVL